uniref:Peptidase M28 n=1 Tax=Anisakis simplex TaxID=6269 RepID=A0A0M3JIH0_ANISI
LVDALADPRAYLSAQEKRKEALHNMGVDDADILEIPANKSNASKSSLLRINGSATNHGGDIDMSTGSKMDTINRGVALVEMLLL